MEEEFLRVHPKLRPFVLSDVQLTGTSIGGGAYGQVDEVTIPVIAAAKTIHQTLKGGPDEPSTAKDQYVRECQLISAVRHPNVVQFMGFAFFPGSRLPALVMERLLTSLHDLLAPGTAPPPLPPPGAASPLAFFSMGLKCSVLHNVACGLAYLHGRSPPVIHRDLSARNVLLNSEMVAKIADLGSARIVPRMRVAATMTKGPGASVYMPPEASSPAKSNSEMSEYDASIDIFSLGIVTIFTIGGTFPCDPLPQKYNHEKTTVARTEPERYEQYMQQVKQQLRACGQFRGDHPLITLIQQCLDDVPANRPGCSEVLDLLEEAKAGFRDGESERNRRDLVRALQTQPKNQNLRCVLQDLVMENAGLQSRHQSVEREFQSRVQLKDRKVAEAQQQLRQKENELESTKREKEEIEKQLNKKEDQQQTIRDEEKSELTSAQQQLREKTEQVDSCQLELRGVTQKLTQQMREKMENLQMEKETARQDLTRKEAELMRVEERIQEMRQRKTELVQAKDRAQHQLRQKEEQLRSSETTAADLLQQRDTKAQVIEQAGQPHLHNGKRMQFSVHVFFIALPVIFCFISLSLKLSSTQQQLIMTETKLVQARDEQLRQTVNSETELVQARDQVQEQLRQTVNSETELVQARDQVQEQLRQTETELVQARDQVQEQLRQTEEQLRSCKTTVADLTPQLRTADGWTALHLAAQEGKVDVVRLLLTEAQALVNIQTKDGRTPLYIASWKGHGTVVKLLLEQHADVNICRRDGASPLFIASQEGHCDVVDILLSNGANINKSLVSGSTPLRVASHNGHKDVVTTLLRNGADVNLRFGVGTILEYLYYVQLHDWKQHLLPLLWYVVYTKFVLQSSRPIDIARSQGHTDIVDLLQQKE